MSSFAYSDSRAAQLRKLTEVSRALTHTVSLDDVLRLAVERGAELLNGEKAVLMLTNDEDLLSVRASCGIDARTLRSLSASRCTRRLAAGWKVCSAMAWASEIHGGPSGGERPGRGAAGGRASAGALERRARVAAVGPG